MKKFVRDAGLVYLTTLLAAWALLYFGGDRWWPGTMLLFAPRWILALPMALLVPATLAFQFRLLPIYVIHLAVLAFPICGVCVPWPLAQSIDDHAERLRVMSCNVGGGELRTFDLIGLIRQEQPDVVLLQECEAVVADEVFASLGWNFNRQGLMAIGSPHPLGPAEVFARHEPYQHNLAAMVCRLDLRADAERGDSAATDETAVDTMDTLQIVNVHLPTPRLGLQEILDSGLEGIRMLNEVTSYRERVSAELTAELAKRPGPMIVAGDFNMPVDSQIYRSHWSQFDNAFSQRGWGVGYTKQTRWHGVRIDHVLAREPWSPQRVVVCRSVGGDHCPQVVELGRQP